MASSFFSRWAWSPEGVVVVDLIAPSPLHSAASPLLKSHQAIKVVSSAVDGRGPVRVGLFDGLVPFAENVTEACMVHSMASGTLCKVTL
jgi:hypothetical protein